MTTDEIKELDKLFPPRSFAHEACIFLAKKVEDRFEKAEVSLKRIGWNEAAIDDVLAVAVVAGATSVLFGVGVAIGAGAGLFARRRK